MGASGMCTWQQSSDCIMAWESQATLAIPWQQGRREAGVRQASAGVAAHRTTLASNTKANFLPIFMAATPQDDSETPSSDGTVIPITWTPAYRVRRLQ